MPAPYIAVVRDGATAAVVPAGEHIVVSLEGATLYRVGEAAAAALLARPWPRPTPQALGLDAEPGPDASEILGARAALRLAVEAAG